ncbi:MAG: hypothetical protein AAFQ82_17870, partial [Myxococcota bacterium]
TTPGVQVWVTGVLLQLAGLVALNAGTRLWWVGLAAVLAVALLLPRTRTLAAGLLVLPFLALPIAKWATDASLSGQLALVSSGVRYLAPAALALWFLGKRRASGALLRVGIAATFIGHGVKALWVHPPYIDLISNSATNLLGWQPAVAQIEVSLQLIGALDILAGLAVLGLSLRVALFYMAVWGAVTALSRITAGGWERLPDVLFRACHVAVPWVLLQATTASKSPYRTPRLSD